MGGVGGGGGVGCDRLLGAVQIAREQCDRLGYGGGGVMGVQGRGE